MHVKVLFFAQARDHAGGAERQQVCRDGATVSELLDSLVNEMPGLAALRPHLAVAIDGELVHGDRPLMAGAEVALLPPVSGG